MAIYKWIYDSIEFKVCDQAIWKRVIRNVTFDDDGVYRCVADGNLTNNPYLNVTGK